MMRQNAVRNRTRRTTTLLLVLLLVTSSDLFSSPSQETQHDSSPARVIRELYRVHNDGRGGVFEAKGKKYIYRFFDQQLADLLWKTITETPEGEVGNLDFDPLYNAQDTQIANFQIGRPLVKGDSAIVLVSFRNFGKRTKITFALHKTEAGWRVSNVDYGKDTNLVKLLSQP